MSQEGLVRALEAQIAHLVSENETTAIARDEALDLGEARLQVLEVYRTAAEERLQLIDQLNARLRDVVILTVMEERLAGLEGRMGAFQYDRDQLRAAEIRIRALEADRDARVEVPTWLRKIIRRLNRIRPLLTH
jgi:hypothetical protein